MYNLPLSMFNEHCSLLYICYLVISSLGSGKIGACKIQIPLLSEYCFVVKSVLLRVMQFGVEKITNRMFGHLATGIPPWYQVLKPAWPLNSIFFAKILQNYFICHHLPCGVCLAVRKGLKLVLSRNDIQTLSAIA